MIRDEREGGIIEQEFGDVTVTTILYKYKKGKIGLALRSSTITSVYKLIYTCVHVGEMYH